MDKNIVKILEIYFFWIVLFENLFNFCNVLDRIWIVIIIF